MQLLICHMSCCIVVKGSSAVKRSEGSNPSFSAKKCSNIAIVVVFEHFFFEFKKQFGSHRFCKTTQKYSKVLKKITYAVHGKVHGKVHGLQDKALFIQLKIQNFIY